MKKLNRENAGLEAKLPIKVVQFGEGNFLRAFVDYAFQKLNQNADFNAGIAVVQPIDRGMVSLLNEQDGLYTLFLKGVSKGKEIQEKELISSIVKGVNPYIDYGEYLGLAQEEDLEFVISNTTEAGIAYVESDTLEMSPPSSFPAKLTALLYERWKHFNGASEKGLTIIPCELINYNSDTLKEIIGKYIDQWKLEDAFKNWVSEACSFHNTLVDRIVPGYPKDQIEAYNKQLEYKDDLIVSAETFFLWVIEGNADLKRKLPFDRTDLDVKIVDSMQPYRTRKVRILNGAHTAMVPFSLLYGNATVKESVDNDFTGSFIRSAVFDEIIPTLDMDKKELEQFAEDIFDRFRNPFIKHQLSSIALNSISKFKVRVLPSLLEYTEQNNILPQHLVYAFACLIRFYKGEWKGEKLPVNDDATLVAEMSAIWGSNDYLKVATEVLSKENYWGQNLTAIKGLTEATANALKLIDEQGIEQGFKTFSTEVNPAI